MPNDSFGNAARRVRDRSPGPWLSWRKMTRHARAIKFIQTYCSAPKGKGYGSPMRLARFQKEFLEASLASGVDAAVMPTPRGNGKSTFSAAIAVWATFDEDDTGAPQVPVIATTMGQAIRSCYGVAESMVRACPDLDTRALIFTGTGTSRIKVPFNEGEMMPVSNDVDGLQGLDPSLALIDEVGFQPIASWDALLLAGGKRERSLTLGLGTPGLDHDNALWHLRELVMNGADTTGLYFREYAADPDCRLEDEAQWRKANPAIAAGFLSIRALRTSLALAPPSHFRVFRLGQWVEGVESWLGDDGASIWDGATNPYEFPDGHPVWVGVDAALTRDTTAVVHVGYRDDGRLHAKCRIWTPKRDEPVDLFDVMGHLRDLAIRYRVGAVAYDPRFMDWPARVLADEGLPVVEVPQSVERMTGPCGDLYTLLRDGQVTHDRDGLFRSHVLNAVTRVNERGFTLSKNRSRGHIDGVIALVLAVDRVRNKQKPRAPLVIL